VNLTRRTFCEGAATAALTTAFVMAGSAWSALLSPAKAQSAPPAGLMDPNPLGEMALGDAKAPVTIIEYASMTCPHCATFHNTTYPELKKRYIDTGKVRFIFREFPLDPVAGAGFMLARCAAKEGGPDRYFAMIEALFHEQTKWAVEKPYQPLLAVAKQAGFTEASFKACIANQSLLTGLEKVRDHAANKYGVKSTPTFFINGKIERGALSIEELAKKIDPYLKSG
jgi:protein-disulfide isomerase